MRRLNFRFLLLTATLLTAFSLVLAAQESAPVQTRVWLGPDGQPLPFQSDQEIIPFLQSASLVSWERIPTGRTSPRKVLLEKDGVRLHAIFRDVRVERDDRRRRGNRPPLRDDFVFECAAYRLNRLLELDNIPPAVERTLFDTQGSLQLWVEQAMTERIRRRKKLIPPDQEKWDRQLQVALVFDRLINNQDRHRSNLLVDSDWKVWLIDHTRAFQLGLGLLEPEETEPEEIKRCDKDLWERLQRLEDQTISEHLRPFLRPKEISDLLVRRQWLLDHIQGLIDEKGAEEVLF